MSDDLAAFLSDRYAEETKRAEGSRKLRRIDGEPCPRCHRPVEGFGSAWAGGAIRIYHEHDHSDFVDGCELSEDEWRAFADDGISDDGARRLSDLESKKLLLDDLLAEKHAVVEEDCWYTCAAATEERDGGEPCSGRGSCDCGRDRRVQRRLRILALPHQQHPAYEETWRP